MNSADHQSGSTATIIRMPYTTSMKGYKGDFLYRTTDFAIWTTVEVGIGISAGCIATLRPLMKSAFEMTRSASAMPWSRPSLKSGMQPSGQQLSELKPHIKKSVTITTSRARRESVGSDEETFLGGSMPAEQWQRQQGLPGYVTSTVLDERTARSKAGEGRAQTTNRGRAGSPGGNSESTFGSKENGKAANVHDRF